MLCIEGDRENATPPPTLRTDNYQPTAVPQSHAYTMPSPMMSKSYTVQHGPAFASSNTNAPAGNSRLVCLYNSIIAVRGNFAMTSLRE